ncbi:MAG: YraN family protein [Formosimonas sp.]
MRLWSKPPPAAPVEGKMRRYQPQADKQKQGAQAEQLALAYLRRQGLCFIDANLACAQGEIDLLMQDGDTLVFVEVRWRQNEAFGGAAASITPAKLQRLTRACQLFLQQNPAWQSQPCRIDAVLLTGDLAAPRMDWLKSITG